MRKLIHLKIIQSLLQNNIDPSAKEETLARGQRSSEIKGGGVVCPPEKGVIIPTKFILP